MLPLKFKYWIPSIFWMGVIFLFSTDLFSAPHTGSIFREILKWLAPSLSDAAVEMAHIGVRKAAHVTSYAALSLFYFMGLSASFRIRGQWTIRRSVTAMALAVAYALTDEWHQSFSVARTASLIDVGWDFTGALGIQSWLFWMKS